MAFFDKLKEAADAAKKTVSEGAEAAKQAYEKAARENAEKKAAEEARKAELAAKAEEIKNNIISNVEANYSEDLEGFFKGKSKEEVLGYAKTFFEKILLPANSKNKSYISMYPHISKKVFEKLGTTFKTTIQYDDCIVYVYDNDGREFLLTYDNFYFKIPLEEDKKFASVGAVPTSKVSIFTLTKNEDGDSYCFACDDVKIADIRTLSGREEDFVTLNSFFSDIKNRDFDITDKDVDAVIRQKIGSMTYSELKNEMDDDELILFFTWSSDGGFIACTTEKVIWADKKSGGNVSNTSTFYYDEITKIEAVQQASNLSSSSSASSLTGFLVDMAVSAAADAAIDSFLKDVCDLKIVTSNSFKTMSGMVKLEADRIVAIYNGFKKELRAAEKEQKNQQAIPQVVVQQQNQPDVLEQIQKLASLKDAGILTEEEFAAKKADLLSKI